jgi:hypothetical protein
VLRLVDGRTSCAVLAARADGFDATAGEPAIRRLASRGVLDLLPPGAAR